MSQKFSKIDDQIKKLREQEKQLELEKRKVEFLVHILDSAKDYSHVDFKEVKEDVVKMLETFVKNSIDQIESGSSIEIARSPSKKEEVKQNTDTFSKETKEAPKPKTEKEIGANEKLNFALDNRHLSGKVVTVANDKNITIKGKVVGLDAPFVLIATDTGPTIKVPLERISLS